MIRKSPGRGFRRRPAGAPATALALAGLAALALLGAAAAGARAAGRGQQGAYWWEVALTLSVRGEFSLPGGPGPSACDYVFRGLWEGRLEPDGDDFLLLLLRTEVLEWRLRDKAGPAGGPAADRLAETPAPALRLNYALRAGQEVEFDFDVEDVACPLRSVPPGIVLEMPRSPGRGPDPPGLRYGDLVSRGSSRIAVPAADFRRRAAERRFAWEWRRARSLEGPRSRVLVQSHAVEAVLKLAARRS